ncbi:MAG: hypothetical protein HZB67_06160 [Candidatus Aenigmarchaeota archaeon]|nr:hypothetical protein [Candidatus Aenigmarchaeota archaeon]
MPYKTKFREVNVPTNAEELRKLGSDANSMRSFGAASYRALHERETGKIVLHTLISSYDKIAFPVIQEEIPSALPNEKRAFIYFLQGIGRAAKKEGDSEIRGYVSNKLKEISSSK